MWQTVATEKSPVVINDTGRKHSGTYGRAYQTNDFGEDVKIVHRVVRGRGRPKSNSGETGVVFVFDQFLIDLQTKWSSNHAD